jgi:hypothetical protein
LYTTRLRPADNHGVAVHQEKDAPAIAFDLESRDAGSGVIDGKQRQDRAFVNQTNLPPFG